MYDFDTIKNQLSDKALATKIRIAWPDGRGERLWAAQLDEQHYALNNLPLFPKYRYMDVVRVNETGTASELVWRGYPTLVRFRWMPIESDVGDADLANRKQLRDCINEKVGEVNFLYPGMGMILLRADVEPRQACQKLLDVDCFIAAVIATFSDEHNAESFELLHSKGDYAS